MQYIDDLLIGSPSKEACEADYLALLKALAANSHKVGRLPDYAKPFTLSGVPASRGSGQVRSR